MQKLQGFQVLRAILQLSIDFMGKQRVFQRHNTQTLNSRKKARASARKRVGSDAVEDTWWPGIDHGRPHAGYTVGGGGIQRDLGWHRADPMRALRGGGMCAAPSAVATWLGRVRY